MRPVKLKSNKANRMFDILETSDDKFDNLVQEFAPSELIHDDGGKFEIVRTTKCPSHNRRANSSLSKARKPQPWVDSIEREINEAVSETVKDEQGML